MKYFIIAGEASGDMHASRIMQGLKETDPQAEFRFIGGDRMQQAATGGLIRHYRELNVMGFLAVIFRIGFFWRLLASTKKQLLEYSPNALILVDYAGFNLRMAKIAAGYSIPVFYYIAPKVWAWKKGRIRSIRKYVDRLFVIFPFEPDFFSRHHVEVSYHGNPLLDEIRTSGEKSSEDLVKEGDADVNGKKIVALLAGSRKQEISRCLPVMLDAADRYPAFRFIIAGAPAIDKNFYEPLIEGRNVEIVYNRTYSLLQLAYAAVVTSGTATLETALFDVPQVVIYRTGWLTYRIGKLFVKLRFFGLVNLIFNDELVKELLQENLYNRLSEELGRLLEDEEYRNHIIAGYQAIEEQLGPPGGAERIASEMYQILSE